MVARCRFAVQQAHGRYQTRANIRIGRRRPTQLGRADRNRPDGILDPGGELDPQAFLATTHPYAFLPGSSVAGEVTFEEVRAHFGVETQRQ
jgi:hypothetical protein